MTLLKKIKIKWRILWEYYIFQKFGIPRVKDEKISKSVLKRYLPPNPVIVDCGAYDGSDSIELVKILDSKLYAFEPVPEIFRRLDFNTKQYKNIFCQQLALSDKNESLKFYISEGTSDASSSLLAPKEHLIDHPDVKFEREIRVTAETLDSWARTNGVDQVDLLWLDMQGYELKMLEASDFILPKVKAIHTEISTKETYSGAGQYTELKKFLISRGFVPVIEAIPQNWDMGNVLFVRQNEA